MYDLNTLYGLGLTGSSIAHDINLNGQIAGQSRFGAFQAQAFVWALFEPGTASTIPLGLLPSGTRSIAYAINDGADAVVVGTGDGVTPCFGGNLPFRVILGGTPALEILGGGHDNSVAVDVNNLTPALIGGVFGPPILPCPPDEPLCTNDRREPTAWNGVTLDPAPPVAPPPLHREDAVRGVNDAGNLVGYGLRPFPSPGSCFRTAGFWLNSDALPFLLGDIMPPGQEFDQSTAEAIREPFDGGRRQVVGWNLVGPKALLWEFDPASGWSVVDLTAVTLNSCESLPCPSGSWMIREAHDINDDGWIVGQGTLAGVGVRAILLVPISQCRDLNGDGVIDGIDLGILLANWSIPTGAPGCGGSVPCFPDYNMDGVVDGIDLGILLAAWGPAGEECPTGAESSLHGGSESMMAADAALVGAPGIEELVQLLIEMGLPELAELLQQVASEE